MQSQYRFIPSEGVLVSLVARIGETIANSLNGGVRDPLVTSLELKFIFMYSDNIRQTRLPFYISKPTDLTREYNNMGSIVSFLSSIDYEEFICVRYLEKMLSDKIANIFTTYAELYKMKWDWSLRSGGFLPIESREALEKGNRLLWCYDLASMICTFRYAYETKISDLFKIGDSYHDRRIEVHLKHVCVEMKNNNVKLLTEDNYETHGVRLTRSINCLWTVERKKNAVIELVNTYNKMVSISYTVTKTKIPILFAIPDLNLKLMFGAMASVDYANDSVYSHYYTNSLLNLVRRMTRSNANCYRLFSRDLAAYAMGNGEIMSGDVKALVESMGIVTEHEERLRPAERSALLVKEYLSERLDDVPYIDSIDI